MLKYNLITRNKIFLYIGERKKMRRFLEEDIIVATEILAYMAGVEKETGRSISLEQAYIDKGVPRDLRLTKEEIKEIINRFLANK